MDNPKLLGKRIKKLRRDCGLTQDKLSELIGMETCSLSSIETGRHFPSLITLNKIAKVLKINLKTFFEYDDVVSYDVMKKVIIDNIDRIKPEVLCLIYKFFENYEIYSGDKNE